MLLRIALRLLHVWLGHLRLQWRIAHRLLHRMRIIIIIIIIIMWREPLWLQWLIALRLLPL